MCIKNDNHMMHDSWDTKCDRQNFLSFWAIFYPFIPPNNPKSQNFEKIIKKKHGDIIILHKWTINDNHKMYGSLRFKARQTEFFVILGHFLPFYLTNNPKKQNFQKMKKTSGDIFILHMCSKNYDQMMYDSCDMARNGRTEKVTYRGGCPTKMILKNYYYFLLLLILFL